MRTAVLYEGANENSRRYQRTQMCENKTNAHPCNLAGVCSGLDWKGALPCDTLAIGPCSAKVASTPYIYTEAVYTVCRAVAVIAIRNARECVEKLGLFSEKGTTAVGVRGASMKRDKRLEAIPTRIATKSTFHTQNMGRGNSII